MNRYLLYACALVLALFICPTPARAAQTVGDSLIVSGGTFKVYPFFGLGGAHIHSPQFVRSGVTPRNGFARALIVYIETTDSDVRVNLYGPTSVDTSAIILRAGKSWGPRPVLVDSMLVTVTGVSATHFKWGLER